MDPLGHMKEITSPETGAHSRRGGRMDAERGGFPQPDQSLPQMEALRAKIEELENWRNNLLGQNGATVNDGMIGIDAKSIRPRGGGAELPAGIQVYMVFNGGRTLVDLPGASVVA